MFSRNYLGVHTPQDVLIGAATGVLCAFLLARLLRWADEGQNRDLLITAIGAALCGLSLWYVLAKSYPADRAADGSLLVDPVKMQKDFFLSAGAVLGMLCGWLLERRKVRFTTDCDWGVKLLRRSIWWGCIPCCLHGPKKASAWKTSRSKSVKSTKKSRPGYPGGSCFYSLSSYPSVRKSSIRLRQFSRTLTQSCRWTCIPSRVSMS